MNDQANDLAGQLVVLLTAVITWLGSQSAVSWIAGGAGGLVRWGMRGKKAARFWKWVAAGVMQMLGGALTARFCWPIALKLIESMTGDLGAPGLDPQSIAAASFVSGAVGISAMRILIAAIEARGQGSIENKIGGRK